MHLMRLSAIEAIGLRGLVWAAGLFLALPGHAAAAGSLVAWGNMAMPPVPPGTRFTAIAAGGQHSLALTAGGNVVAWGYNAAGQCMVPDGLSNVVAIAGGGYHSLALKADGTVAVWQIGVGCGQNSVPMGLSNVTAIAAGTYWSLAVKADGTVVQWGGCSELFWLHGPGGAE